MYPSQGLGKMTLSEVTDAFDPGSRATAGSTITTVRRPLTEDTRLKKTVDSIPSGADLFPLTLLGVKGSPHRRFKGARDETTAGERPGIFGGVSRLGVPGAGRVE